jgi:hypothetical protein
VSSAILSLTHGEAKADLILQYGEGTQNPSVMIENYSKDEQISLGDIQRFQDGESTSAALAPAKTGKTFKAKP